MKPSEARAQLLAQHARIRALLEGAGTAARQVLAGAGGVDFRRIADELRAALVEHNLAEEAVLEPILRAGDAWGPVRVSRMIEEHAGEHAAFREALDGTDGEVAARMADLAEEIEAHMLAEERTFLSPSVLRDDVINLESSS
jgi:iron-sulfur cluster repair protein YtfE (RIC family)